METFNVGDIVVPSSKRHANQMKTWFEKMGYDFEDFLENGTKVVGVERGYLLIYDIEGGWLQERFKLYTPRRPHAVKRIQRL